MKLIRVFKVPVLDVLLNIVVFFAGIFVLAYVLGATYALIEKLFL